MALRAVPMELKQANAYVEEHHRQSIEISIVLGVSETVSW